MDALRILAVYAGPFPAPMGTQVLVSGILCHLAGQGHEVHLAAYRESLDAPAPDGVTIHRPRTLPMPTRRQTGPAWQRPINDLVLARLVQRLTNRIAPDLVYAHHYEALAASLLSNACRNRPLVFHCHALWSHELPTYPALPKRLAALAGRLADQRLALLADRIITLDPAMAEDLAIGGADPSRIDVVAPGIDLDLGLPDPEFARARLGLADKRVVAYLGNLEPYQGVTGLVEAVGIVAKRFPGIALAIATLDPGDRLSLAARAGGLGMERIGHVLILSPGGPGPVPGTSAESTGLWSESLDVLSAASMLIVPRLIPGGVAIKLLNALSARRPVVVSDAAAMGLVDENHALVYPAGQAKALARQIERILASPDLGEKLAAEGRRHVEAHHAWPACTAMLETALHQAVSGPRPRCAT